MIIYNTYNTYYAYNKYYLTLLCFLISICELHLMTNDRSGLSTVCFKLDVSKLLIAFCIICRFSDID